MFAISPPPVPTEVTNCVQLQTDSVELSTTRRYKLTNVDVCLKSTSRHLKDLVQSMLKLFWGLVVAQHLIKITDVGFSSPLVAFGVTPAPTEM